MTNWKPFWFESNVCWGRVDSEQDWREIVKTFNAQYRYQEPPDVMTAQECEYNREFPNFGFRCEHQGKKKLKDFFEENGMSYER